MPDLKRSRHEHNRARNFSLCTQRFGSEVEPCKIPRMPPTLAALTGFILEARFCLPHITDVMVTDSGIVLARTNADIDATRVLGSYSDVLRNWMRLISSAGLSSREFMEVQCLFAAKIGFLGQTNA